MSPEAQRVAIAEACGWTIWSFTGTHGDEVWWSHANGVSKLRDNPPDYLSDLNAIHEVEKVLRTNPDYMRLHAWNVYCQHLGFYLTDRNVYDNNCIHTTAAQRAEAFLRTIGKWVES